MFTAKLKVLAALSAIAAMSLAVVALSQTSPSIPTATAATSDYFLKLEGIDGEIIVDSFSWGVISPRDAASGLPTGKRQYEPIIIRKRVDKASPLLFKAATEKQNRMKSVTLTGTNAQGATFTVSFFDVFVDMYRQSGDAGSTPTESVSFTYQKIEWK
ncbi:MAG: type VI secretion system tube protein Hcp [Candidatus Peregrinibacteria bacterium]|nr:type VI secretion system tube protein Hcp [Candidatus Peregrinibacteria bacterium]